MDNVTEVLAPLVVSSDALDSYERDGFVLLKGLLAPEIVRAVHEEVMDIMRQIGLGQSKLRQSSRYLSGSAIDRLIHSRRLCDAAGALMRGPSTVYLPFTAVKSANGGGRFHFHQDNNYTHFDGPGINFWFALSEMAPETGCLQFVPGSHVHGTLESMDSEDHDGHRAVRFEPEDFLSLLMEPGDCVAFTRLTVHGSGRNITDRERVAYSVQFYRDDVRARWGEMEDHVLLKTHPRHNIGPVARIVEDAKPEDLDGH